MKAEKTFLAKYQLPDFIYRFGIRRLLSQKLKLENKKNLSLRAYAHFLKHQHITIECDSANEQHYEVPTSFFNLVLGKHKKYSCCLFKNENDTLDQAEENMLALTVKRAGVIDGDKILELGCGWGALSLYLARHFPNSQITALSNSKTQKKFIDSCAKRENLQNLEVVTDDIALFNTRKRFDRILSLEMFEHVRNYELLFEKVAKWLKPEGFCFVHIFGHKERAYLFDDNLESSWMARHFFTGGQMPAKELFAYFPDHLSIKNMWTISGNQYKKTAHAWLKNMDEQKSAVLKSFGQADPAFIKQQWIYWRLFFHACAELFGYNNGQEWQVYHYLFSKT